MNKDHKSELRNRNHQWVKKKKKVCQQTNSLLLQQKWASSDNLESQLQFIVVKFQLEDSYMMEACYVSS